MIIVVFASCAEKITGSGLTIFNGAYPVRLWVPWIHRMGWITASVIWNHGLQREVGIEAVCECFNGSEWECVWMSGMLIIWNGNKKWVLMEWRGQCHDEISIANRWYDDDINAWWFWILCWMMLIRWDDCIQETEGMRWKMILECRLKAVEITSSISLTG